MQGSGEQFPPGDGAEELPRARAPHRVIGTPQSARARTLLEAPPQEDRRPERWLPAEPSNLDRAKRAERLVAALFILSMLASIGFVAAYVGLEVHSVAATQRSNLALGVSMSVAFGALAVGVVIWVRYLMPKVELTEERKPLASSPKDRAEFDRDFTEGAEASGFVKRPLLRRTLIAASVPLAVAPLVILRDLGPLPGTSLRHTVWRKGLRLLVFGPNTPLRPADFADDRFGIPTVTDILAELAKPGRDPRQQFEPFSFAEGIHKLQDLKPGLKLPGIITNVTAFGAFVDIGVHQDGLVHISQLADKFVKDPN